MDGSEDTGVLSRENEQLVGMFLEEVDEFLVSGIETESRMSGGDIYLPMVMHYHFLIQV